MQYDVAILDAVMIRLNGKEIKGSFMIVLQSGFVCNIIMDDFH